ncbi:MAG: hypothetical protein ACLPQ4_00625 [Thermoplasmata archaeon]
MAGLTDRNQAALMAIAFALAGIGTVALPTSLPWEVRIIPALLAAAFGGVKEALGGTAPAAAAAPAATPTEPQPPKRIAAVLKTDDARPYLAQGYTLTSEVEVGAKTYFLLEKSS